MKVTVFLEERFILDGNGRLYSSVFNKDFWARYLSVFDEVEIVARAEKRADNFVDVSEDILSPQVSLRRLPSYRGGAGFFASLFCLFVTAWRAVASSSCFVLRIPGGVSLIAFILLRISGKRYAVELVGDPYEVFQVSSRPILLRRFLSFVFFYGTKFCCAYAEAVSYVSLRQLQRRYPANPKALVSHFSSIDLPDDAIVSVRPICSKEYGDYSLLGVGSMEELYKGFDILLEALPKVREVFPEITLTLIGDGRYRNYLEKLALHYSVRDCVTFEGRIPREDVIAVMDRVDLLVAPSRTEGLPRVLIEGLSRGVPCIGTSVGGIPDILDDDSLVPREDAEGLAKRIILLLQDRSIRESLSNRGIRKARGFSRSVLSLKRFAFYSGYLSRMRGP